MLINDKAIERISKQFISSLVADCAAALAGRPGPKGVNLEALELLEAVSLGYPVTGGWLCVLAVATGCEPKQIALALLDQAKAKANLPILKSPMSRPGRKKLRPEVEAQPEVKAA